MDRPSSIACLILAGCALAPAARAQPTPPVRPIDAGVADVGPLAESLRITPIDLRKPSRFDAVYRTHDDQLMRIDGGLRAVFPRSVYAASPGGAVALIPPGTVFYIGDPPAATPAAGQAPSRALPAGHRETVSTLIDARLETAAASGRVFRRLETAQGWRTTPVEHSPGWTSDPSRDPAIGGLPAPTTLWNDDRFRARRLDALLTRAAANR